MISSICEAYDSYDSVSLEKKIRHDSSGTKISVLYYSTVIWTPDQCFFSLKKVLLKKKEKSARAGRLAGEEIKKSDRQKKLTRENSRTMKL